MTITQLKKVGISTNKWVDLSDNIFQILFSNEGSLYPSKLNSQYYFDSADGLLFVKYCDGFKINYIPSDMSNYAKFIIDGQDIYTTLIDGGFKDSKVGRYHEVYDLDEITLVRTFRHYQEDEL